MADSQPKPPTKPPNQQINGAGSQTQGVQLLPLITKYFKTAGVLLLAWSAGYFRFSSTWVLIGMFFYVINEEYRKVKSSKRAFAQQAILNEKQAILARVDELPSWMNFSNSKAGIMEFTTSKELCADMLRQHASIL
ncbi:hypothetical protein CAPTEDRAFT_201276 [Capitella teleta]|uniref:Uncharacterized protein n=1 Tax=Capitella teleta TaxID=283909 RepID=R7U7Y7_CAPTE|nr:hypothetical protein CAPTEDRAFT_201276 [Capitella teleta]|eukprot:ELU02460.1 hypothetical protein CAPTEDRAFT_201276 [Capitella teleta]